MPQPESRFAAAVSSFPLAPSHTPRALCIAYCPVRLASGEREGAGRRSPAGRHRLVEADDDRRHEEAVSGQARRPPASAADRLTDLRAERDALTWARLLPELI
jgi:hypothetical protein